MRSKTLVVLAAVAVMSVSSIAMAKGLGGVGGGGSLHGVTHGGTSMHGPGHFIRPFDHRFHFSNRFNRNPLFLGGWGWGLGGYGEDGYSNTNVVVYPHVTPQFATGSIATTPCHWNSETFSVPSSSGGNRPVEVVSCR
jgi:hypothetical protein